MAEPIKLVEQIECHIDAFVVDAELGAQLDNEGGARNIDVPEPRRFIKNERGDPPPIDKHLQAVRINAEIPGKFFGVEHLHPHRLSWIVSFGSRPTGNKGLEIGVGLIGKDDLERCVEIAPGAIAPGRTFAFNPQRPAT